MALTRQERSAVLSRLVQAFLKDRKTCGELLLHKAVYVLERVLQVPLGFEYLQYMHGPRSFEMAAHLSIMLSDRVLQRNGKTILALGENYKQLSYDEVAEYDERIQFVVREFHGHRMPALACFTTALYEQFEHGHVLHTWHKDPRAYYLRWMNQHHALAATIWAKRFLERVHATFFSEESPQVVEEPAVVART